MNTYFFIYFICCTFYFTIGIVSIVNNRKAASNQLLLVICLNLAHWSLMLGLMSMSTEVTDALFYRRLMVFSWSTLYAEILFFILLLTKNKKFYDRPWKVILIAFPAMLNIYVYYFYPVTANDFIAIRYGWAFLNPTDRGLFWEQLLNVYYTSYILLSIILLNRWVKQSPYEREKRQGRIILRAFVYIIISGTITDILLPGLGIALMPPATVIMSTVAIGGIAYAIIVYKMMNITPENIMLDVYKSMNEGILIVDRNDEVLSLNTGGEHILGYLSKEIEGSKFNDLVMFGGKRIHIKFDENFSSKEVVVQRKDNRMITLLMSGFYHYDQFNHKFGTVYTFQDIDELKSTQFALEEARNNLEEKVDHRTKELKSANIQLKIEIKNRIEKEAKIHELAYKDQLTGLPNRRYFYHQLDRIMNADGKQSRTCAVLFMDLDGFKLINDTLGHDKGDELLVLVAKRVRHNLRESDLICRVGGDEFLILIEDFEHLEELDKICKKIIYCLQAPFKMASNTVHVKSSIGIACYPGDGLRTDDLVKHADIAMYRAKDRGKNRYVFFDGEMKKGIDETMYLTNDLYRAYEQKELEVYYQPQMDTESQKISGFEALLRWNHPSMGVINPGTFIPLAERTGLIVPIGEWVIQSAAKQQMSWKAKFGLDVTMGINLSMVQLKTDQLEVVIAKTILETKVDPSKLEFEITENLFMDDTDYIVSKLIKIKALGAKISIDDFGTEYSSLSYLKMLPMDRIKIPKPFVEGINIYPKDEAIISSLIVLAKKLGCKVIAEGVEEKDQFEYLKQSKCDDIQGHYFYKAMKVKELEASLQLKHYS